MEDTKVQTPTTPTPLQVVPLQAVAPPGGFSTIAPLAIIQEGSQATGVAQVENRIDNRILQQLRWIEKMVYVLHISCFVCYFEEVGAYVCVSSHG